MTSSLLPLADSTLQERALRRAVRAVVEPAVRASYRVRIHGMQNVPRRGGALVVCNHVSFIDWVFVGLALPRLPHFVMHHAHWRSPTLRWFFDLHRVIPIAPAKEDPAMRDAALASIGRALDAGELVMLFPEGTMTPDGALSPIRPGVERIVARHPVPVVPLALRGLWGGFFSRCGGEPMTKRPRALRPPVHVVAGRPLMPSEVSAARLAATFEALLRTASGPTSAG